LSTPTPYVHSSLNTPDDAVFAGLMSPGTNCADAPVKVAGRASWLLNPLGDGFVLLSFGKTPVASVSFGQVSAKVLTVGVDLIDEAGVLTERYDGQPGTVVLIRPDQHVAARWREFDTPKIQAALARCLAA
jgi:3-(3-hydroxy-phenyl)propionate hydroxylase